MRQVERRRQRRSGRLTPGSLSDPGPSASELAETSPTPVIHSPSEVAEAGPAVHVQGSPLRCPFCHDNVDPNAADWVACRACLARHHTACWGEGGACGACGSDHRLVMEASSPSSEPAWEAVDAADYWRARARHRTAEREAPDARRPTPPRRRDGSARRRATQAPPTPEESYLALQGVWLVLFGVAIMATGIPHFVFAGGALGLISTVQLWLESSRKRGSARAAGISSVLTVSSFVAALPALSGLARSAALGMIVLAFCAFACSWLLGARRGRR